jgi:hypothetical protein
MAVQPNVKLEAARVVFLGYKLNGMEVFVAMFASDANPSCNLPQLLAATEHIYVVLGNALMNTQAYSLVLALDEQHDGWLSGMVSGRTLKGRVHLSSATRSISKLSWCSTATSLTTVIGLFCDMSMPSLSVPLTWLGGAIVYSYSPRTKISETISLASCITVRPITSLWMPVHGTCPTMQLSRNESFVEEADCHKEPWSASRSSTNPDR